MSAPSSPTATASSGRSAAAGWRASTSRATWSSTGSSRSRCSLIISPATTELRARFVREGRLAARLAHPNVVGVLDAGETDGLPFIVMEYVEGETFADVVRREGALPWDRAVSLAAAGARRARARARCGPRPS